MCFPFMALFYLLCALLSLSLNSLAVSFLVLCLFCHSEMLIVSGDPPKVRGSVQFGLAPINLDHLKLIQTKSVICSWKYHEKTCSCEISS